MKTLVARVSPILLVSLALAPLGACIDAPPDEEDAPERLAKGAALDENVTILVDEIALLANPVELTRAAMERALMATGFGIRIGETAFADETRGQGIVFEPWDIDTMAAAYRAGVAIPLDELAGVLSDLVDGAVSPADLRAALLDDLARAAATTENEPRRAAAQLVIALGRSGLVSSDLLDPDVDGQAPIDALQLGILTYRIAAELAGTSGGAAVAQASQALEGELPCTQSEVDGIVMDQVAVASGAVLSGVSELIGDALGSTAWDGAMTKLAAANALLAYAKLAWTMAVYKVELSVENGPLPRTLDRTPGAQRTVHGTFAIDGTGAAQIVNCVRIALNALNLDFSLPPDGPLAGTRVEWEVIATGDDDVIWSKSHSDPSGVVNYAGGDLRDHATDADGKAALLVEGKPQSEDLSDEDLVEVHRHPKVRATTNLKNKNIAQDLVDLGGAAGGLGGLITLPVEILNRRPLLFTGAVVVPVIDHRPLEGDLFRIEGDFTQPDSTVGDGAVDVRDRFVAEVELRNVVDGTPTAELLSFVDEQTTLTDAYEATGPAGEGCTHVTTPIGTSEVFTSTKTRALTYVYSPAVPEYDLEEFFQFVLVREGSRRYRGWDVQVDQASCIPTSDPVEVKAELVAIGFDSTTFPRPSIGESIEIDERNAEGTGWVFTVTYVK